MSHQPFIRTALAAFILCGLVSGPVCAQSISGFGSFIFNNNGAAPPSVTNNVLQLTTDGVQYTANSGFYSTPVNVGAFSVEFVYMPQYNPALNTNGLLVEADGATFCLQNDPAGVNALGYWGSDLGYSNEQDSSSPAITNSVALAFNIYAGHTVGTNLFEDGNNPNFDYNPTGIVNLENNDGYAVFLNYDGSTLSEDIYDLNTGATFHTSYDVDIPSVVGNTTAYMGFTGGTGGGFAGQYVSSFTYNPGAYLSVTPGTRIGGETTTASIHLPSPVLSNTKFLVQVSNPALVTSFPGTVVIKKGLRTVAFPITTSPEATNQEIEVAVTGDNLTMENGFNVKATNLTSNAISLSADPVVGGSWLGAQITLDGPAPAGGAVINLDASPNPAGAVQSFLSAPPGTPGSTTILSVNIPAGQTTAEVYIQTSLVARNVNVRIQGKYNGVTSGAPLTILPPQG